jgi:Plasmid pRiA4b ORF-3-like protein
MEFDADVSYTYDFGDDWRHSVTTESVTAADPKLDYPRFIDGDRRAPTSLKGLHDVIQAVMPFENYHFFRFDVGDKRYEMRMRAMWLIRVMLTIIAAAFD